MIVREYFKIVLEKSGNNLSPKVSMTLSKDLCNATLTMNLLDEGLEYCQKSIELAKIFPNSKSIIADNLQLIGNYHRKNNNFEKARSYFEDALQTISKISSGEAKKSKAEIYDQLSHLYLMKYLQKEEGKPADDYGIKALETLGGNEYFHTKEKPLPAHITCDVARHRWKYSEVMILHKVDFDAAHSNLLEAEYIMNNRCPGNLQLKGRIYGILGEIFVRKGNLQEAERKLTEAIDIINVALGQNSSWTYNVRRAGVRIRLQKFDEAYEDCMKVFNLGLVETTNFHSLRYFMAFYNGAFAQYKLKNYQKSMIHFTDFIKNMDGFCKDFLEEKTYASLKADNIFATPSYNAGTELADIKIYLKHSLIIFTAIFGEKHPFVREYVAKNIDA